MPLIRDSPYDPPEPARIFALFLRSGKTEDRLAATLKTVEQIDVIWLKNRSMARASEVEHTTGINSGLLRMADLLALQPNMDISLHLVAPDEKRDKVIREIRRPVFSLLDRGPLYESCTFIPKAVDELALKQLAHMSDSILDEFDSLFSPGAAGRPPAEAAEGGGCHHAPTP